MTALKTIFDRMADAGSVEAIAWRDECVTYRDLLDHVDTARQRLRDDGVRAGDVVAVEGEYHLGTVSLMLALIQENAVLVPLAATNANENRDLCRTGHVGRIYRFAAGAAEPTVAVMAPAPAPALLDSFRARGNPGLIVFTSGSTGKPKAILHDVEAVAMKFEALRKGWRSVLFLTIDHFGGFNTLLSCFSYLGTAICVEDRNPATICAAIARHRADLLPTTPTFLNLLLASGAHRTFDLSSIRLITYGTEVMPDATLVRAREAFPHAEFKQTYGLSELGVLRSRSEDDGSTWVRIGGDGFDVRVVDGMLYIRSQANMVGYLNAPNPFDEEGWFPTGDCVEIKGDYMRILGRTSDMINVGGQKVFPAEVESVLMMAGNVKSATVYGAAHPLLGRVVNADVATVSPEDARQVTERLRKACIDNLARFKVPVRINVVEGGEKHTHRFKKKREPVG